ncbi:MAG: phosphatase PAP2 family protein [Nocardioidaceae bacterium]
MTATTAALVAAFAALAGDVRRDGFVPALERRYCMAPAAASPLTLAITELGGRTVAGSALLVCGAVAWARGPERGRACAVRFLITISGRAVMARLVRRRRPPRGWWQQSPTGFSFPSRHTTWAMLAADEAVAALPGGARRWARLGQVALVASVGMSRVAVGVHWPSDVVGALLWEECCRRGGRWFRMHKAREEAG